MESLCIYGPLFRERVRLDREHSAVVSSMAAHLEPHKHKPPIGDLSIYTSASPSVWVEAGISLLLQVTMFLLPTTPKVVHRSFGRVRCASRALTLDCLGLDVILQELME